MYHFNKRQWRFIQFICWTALYDSFVLFEETVVDRQGLWKYLPGYDYGCFCLWDIGALVVFAILVYFVFRTPESISATPSASQKK
jgi:hypothetical protein